MRPRRGPERGVRLRQAMHDPGRTWWITRQADAYYHLIREIGGGEYLDWEFRSPPSLAGGYQVPQLATAAVGVPMVPVDEDQAVYSGSWTSSFMDASTGYAPRSTTGSMTALSNVLTVPSGGFTAASVGRRVTVTGAGAGGADLTANITGYTSASQVSLASSAQTTVSGAPVLIWPGYRFATASGATATWTSPAGTTDLGLIIVQITNGGLAKVAIDGDPTAAVLLPTAQQVVTSGLYPASILAANGGTLQPTDRVVSCYLLGASYTVTVGLATGLTPGVHTVTVTATGYAPTSAPSANRAYVSAFCAGAAGAVTPQTPGALTVSTAPVLSMQSTAETLYWWDPPGATHPDFVGRVHGYEAPVSLAFALDGSPVTIPVGGALAVPPGSRATMTQTTSLRHPNANAGATPIADVTFVYALDELGMTIDATYASLITATLPYGYAAMLPADDRFHRYTSSGLRAAVTATDADNSQKGPARAWIGAMWSPTGRYAMSLELLNPGEAVNGWQRSAPGHMFLQDRSPSGGQRITKIYASRIGSPSTAETVTPGTVLRSQARYRFKRFSSGTAESVLAAI